MTHKFLLGVNSKGHIYRSPVTLTGPATAYTSRDAAIAACGSNKYCKRVYMKKGKLYMSGGTEKMKKSKGVVTWAKQGKQGSCDMGQKR